MIAGRANPKKGRPPQPGTAHPRRVPPAGQRETTKTRLREVGRVGTGQVQQPAPPRGRRAGRARNNPTGAQGVPACPLPPTHTQGTRGARTRTRSRTTRQPPGKPPPGNRGGPWRGRKRGGAPAWGGGGRAAESGGDTGRPASTAPHGPDRPDPRRTGDPQRVFKPPRRDALGTWTGWRRARWVGDEGARDTANHLDAGPPGAAAGPTNGNRKPRRCRPVTEAPTGANRPPTDRRRPTPLASPPHDPHTTLLLPPHPGPPGLTGPGPALTSEHTFPVAPTNPHRPLPRTRGPGPPPLREGGCGGKRGTSGQGRGGGGSGRRRGRRRKAGPGPDPGPEGRAEGRVGK